MRAIVFYVSTGQGFKSPADAIARELKAKGIEAESVDFFAAVGMTGWDRLLKESWLFCLRHPWIFRLIYGQTNSPLVSLLFPLMLPSFKKRFPAYLEGKDVDFVASTHFLVTWILGRHEPIASGKLPFFAYNSDVLLSHRAYIQNKVSAYFVSTELGRRLMIEDGQAPELLHLTGFPIDPKYKKAFGDRTALRSALGLEDRFTLLVTFGGEGIGNTALIEAIVRRGLPAQVVAVCGRNEATRLRLERLASDHPEAALKVVGFTDRLQDYLYACDLSAGKSGLNTAFESIYMRRPFLVLMAMANERHCADFLVSRNYAKWPASVEKACAFVEGAMGDSAEFRAMQEALTSPPCTFDIDDMIERMTRMTTEKSGRR